MTTRYMTSPDGLNWQDRGVVLSGRAGQWDARGARVTAVLSPRAADRAVRRPAGRGLELVRAHRGRRPRDGELRPVDDVVIGSPHGDGALRYACAVPQADGRTRFYFEAARPDGAHDLLTSVA